MAPPEMHTNAMHDNAIALMSHPLRKAVAASLDHSLQGASEHFPRELFAPIS
jgi:hypothetical protein